MVSKVPQKHPASQVIPGYDKMNGAAIAIKDYIHRMIPKITGNYKGTDRELLLKDAKDLREAGIPSGYMLRLIEAAKAQFPISYAKPPRVKKP